MKQKTVCIVHYNTPELTKAAVLSIRKQGGGDYRVVIFENSCDAKLAHGESREARPFARLLSDEQTRKALGEVEIIDNSRGQLVDFDKELAKWPRKRNDVESRSAHFGSAKHMMSVEWLVQNMDAPFILCDSDILLKQPIDDMFDETVTAVGHVDNGWQNPEGVQRLMPMLCYINAPECRRLGIHYYDGGRCWAILNGKKNCWYDTGASFLEDIRNHPEGKLRQVNIIERIEHLWSASWKKEKEAEGRMWLNKHADLWKPSPRQLGIRKVAICAIARQENRYICEWLDYYKSIGVAKVFLYDNYHQGEERLIDVVQPYIDEGFVELNDYHDREFAQCPAYNDCYNRHGHEYAWIGFFDIDEFLRFEGKNIEDFMERYTAGSVLLVNWRLMTDNGLVHYDPRPVQERFTEPMKIDQRVKYDFPENRHIKSMVRGGLSSMSFTGHNPHCPKKPNLYCINAQGKRTEQSAFADIDHSLIWLDHYWTKTAEEWVNVKLSRGYHGDALYTQQIIQQNDRNFFSVNKRTAEKEEMMRPLIFRQPQTERIMEHIAKTAQGSEQWRLTAENGWLLKSKLSGKTYKTIDTRDLKRWEAVEDPDFVKPEPKAVAKTPHECTETTEPKTESKPKTTKRTNRKGK